MTAQPTVRPGSLRVAVGSDTPHETAELLVRHLERTGHTVVRCGAVSSGQPNPWPDVAADVARCLLGGQVDEAVVCCWTGTGVSIAANKFRGVRAALCADVETAIGARRWNDANVLALSLSGVNPESAAAITDAWLQARGRVDESERANIARLAELEKPAR